MTHPFDEIDEESLASFKTAAEELSSRYYPILNKVVLAIGQPLEWRRGGDRLAVNTEAIALVDLAQRGWQRYADGKLAEQYWGVLIGRKPLPRPANHTDETKWEYWPGSDRRRDPWQCKFRLPLRILNGDATDQVGVFVASNEATRAVLAPLCQDFLERRRRQRVLLTSAQAPGAKAYRPLLRIVGYTEDCDDLPGWHAPEEPQAAPADGDKEPMPYAGELDHSIPF